MKKRNFFISAMVLVMFAGLVFVSYQSYKHEIGDWLGYHRCPACNGSFWEKDEVRFRIVRDLLAEEEKLYIALAPGVRLLSLTHAYNISFCSDCVSSPPLLKKALKSKGWHPAKIQAVLNGIKDRFSFGPSF